ncbi:MAG: hypothetical protein WD738_02685 [Pirellulales bacterium]
MRRNPFPFYDEFRAASPLLHLEPFDLWLIFDYAYLPGHLACVDRSAKWHLLLLQVVR